MLDRIHVLHALCTFWGLFLSYNERYQCVAWPVHFIFNMKIETFIFEDVIKCLMF